MEDKPYLLMLYETGGGWRINSSHATAEEALKAASNGSYYESWMIVKKIEFVEKED